ncbi:uncharacterized protein BJX67DRAFT_24132 [Aspergillus lucknowensis]|uniref:Uncharacterized protein n=1 Tax=Aspergillus lucknowensis TaxID=176173 RepID=A0ABR4M148_9EURO
MVKSCGDSTMSRDRCGPSVGKTPSLTRLSRGQSVRLSHRPCKLRPTELLREEEESNKFSKPNYGKRRATAITRLGGQEQKHPCKLHSQEDGLSNLSNEQAKPYYLAKWFLGSHCPLPSRATQTHGLNDREDDGRLLMSDRFHATKIGHIRLRHMKQPAPSHQQATGGFGSNLSNPDKASFESRVWAPSAHFAIIALPHPRQNPMAKDRIIRCFYFHERECGIPGVTIY